MAQRTEFPILPNTPESIYLEKVAQLFSELQRQDGRVPFKKFRPWMKDHDIYDKENVDALFSFLGCESKPEIVLGDFAARYLECKSKEEKQRLLFDWLMAWNPFLIKYVFEAMDVDNGGRLHSEHELYRLITSYVYAGEYINLVNFQNWLKWMTASGFIRLIGIRWGLSESGKLELKNIKKIDVEEMLEDEEEAAAAAAGTAAEEPELKVEMATPVVPKSAPVVEKAATEAAPTPEASSEEMPDMPPEAPLPEWTAPADHPLAELEAEAEKEAPSKSNGGGNGSAELANSAAPAPQKSKATAPKSKPLLPSEPNAEQKSMAQRVNAWFKNYEGRQPDQASQLGMSAKDYGKKPPLFVYKMTLLSQLATGLLPVAVWEPLWRRLLEHKVLDEYFEGKRGLEDLLANEGWFQDNAAYRQAFSSIAFEAMRAKSTLSQGGQGLCDLIEDALDGASLIVQLHERIFQGEISAAPFWMLREMFLLGIWDNPAFADYAAVPSRQARANACRLALIASQYAYSFESLCESAQTLARHFPAAEGGDYAMSYVHEGLDGPSLQLPFREQG